MNRQSLTVVKVGGSLFDWPEFPRSMAAFLETLDRILTLFDLLSNDLRGFGVTQLGFRS